MAVQLDGAETLAKPKNKPKKLEKEDGERKDGEVAGQGHPDGTRSETCIDSRRLVQTH